MQYPDSVGLRTPPPSRTLRLLEGSVVPLINPTIRDSSISRGFVHIACPYDSCDYVHRFIETIHTQQERMLTFARRREYLRLSHEAGRHADGD